MKFKIGDYVIIIKPTAYKSIVKNRIGKITRIDTKCNSKSFPYTVKFIDKKVIENPESGGGIVLYNEKELKMATKTQIMLEML